MRKHGPKKVCRIERKWSQNGAQFGTRHLQHFEKYKKKDIPETIRKQKSERNLYKPDLGWNAGCRCRMFQIQILDPNGLRPNILTRPAPGGCGGCFLIQNGDMGLPDSTYPLIFDIFVRCQKVMFFGSLPNEPKNPHNRAVGRQRVAKGTSHLRN